MSHLLQMRGLKPSLTEMRGYANASHLLQMRGLKRKALCPYSLMGKVASFTDAWIETWLGMETISNEQSHLLQMRGLKLKAQVSETWSRSRIFYRCVD